jgi:hypothetical protein
MSLSLALFLRSCGGRWAEEAGIPTPPPFSFPRNQDFNKKEGNIPNANKNSTTKLRNHSKSSMSEQDFYVLKATINLNLI